VRTGRARLRHGSDGRLIADAANGHIPATSCIPANLSMKLGRSLTRDAEHRRVTGDDEANALLRRPNCAPWVHPGG
jgi:hypothetical protein